MDVLDWVIFTFELSAAERRHRKTLRRLRALETKYGEATEPAPAPPRLVERGTVRVLDFLFGPRRRQRLKKARERAEASRVRLAAIAAARQRRAVAREDQKKREVRNRERERDTARAIEAEIAAIKAEGDALAEHEREEREALNAEIAGDRSAALRTLGAGIARIIVYIFAGFGLLFFVMTMIIGLIDKHR